MKKTIVMSVLLLSSIVVFSQIPSAEVQIKTALLAAPADKRADAMVYGYNEKGDIILLRKGKNEIVCIGDDPKVEGHLPRPFGVFYQTDRPCYEDVMSMQLEDAKARKKGDLDKLLRGNEVWTIQ